MHLLAKIKHGSGALHHRRGPVPYLVHKGERYLSSFAFGAAKGYYRERTLLGGRVPLDLAVGGTLTLGAALLNIYAGMHGRRSTLAEHLDPVGDSGVTSWINSMGAAWGAKKSGRQVLVLNAGATAPAQLPAGFTRVAGIPQHLGGAFLSDEQIANYNAGRY
jgi:hypothetical protein